MDLLIWLFFQSQYADNSINALLPCLELGTNSHLEIFPYNHLETQWTWLDQPGRQFHCGLTRICDQHFPVTKLGNQAGWSHPGGTNQFTNSVVCKSKRKIAPFSIALAQAIHQKTEQSVQSLFGLS